MTTLGSERVNDNDDAAAAEAVVVAVVVMMIMIGTSAALPMTDSLWPLLSVPCVLRNSANAPSFSSSSVYVPT